MSSASRPVVIHATLGPGRDPRDREDLNQPGHAQGWVEGEMRMSSVHKQSPALVAAHPGNRELPSVRTDSTRIGVRRAGSRK